MIPVNLVKVISDNLIGSSINVLSMNFYSIVKGTFFEESEAEGFVLPFR